MKYVSWRDHARPIIARVLQETTGCSEREIKKALHDAYPFGPRAMHPYKIWLDEIARQRGRKRNPHGERERRRRQLLGIDQGDLFAEKPDEAP